LPRTHLSVPAAVKLTNESTWSRRENGKGSYRMMRFHYVLDEHGLTGKPKMGGILGMHANDQGTAVQLHLSHEVEITTLRFEQTIREHLVNEEVVSDVNQKIGTALSLPEGMFKASAELASGIKETIAESVKTATTLQHSFTEVRREKFDVTYEMDGQAARRQVEVAMYERRTVDVYLVYIDFLEVNYKRSAMGLRKKRIKNPAFLDNTGTLRPNEIRLHDPIGAYNYWRLVPRTSWMIPENRYRNQVGDHTEVTRTEIGKPRLYERKNFPRVPSLYQISNAAFPLKWAKRQGDCWTDEELLELEQEEELISNWIWRIPDSARR
jgi:hypothetical protein